MQIIYFILAIVILAIWLGPYVLIVLVLWWIIALVTRKGTEVNNKSANKFDNNSPNNTSIKEANTTYFPKDYFEISQQQSKKIQSVINILKTTEASDTYKIIHRLNSLELSYWEQRSVYISSDLYSHILKVTRERIGSAKRDFVKRECEIVMQIVELLKENTSADDIVRAILPPKEDAVNVVKYEVVVADTEDSINEPAKGQSEYPQDNGWEAVEDLENHPLRDKEYCRQLHKRVEVLHQNGELDKEIDFIRETIQSYESAELPCRYWQLLLNVRIAEASKKRNVELIAPVVSQIVASLAENATRQEKDRPVESEYSTQSTDISDGIFDRFRISRQNRYDDDVCPTEGVPYWEHTYVYSVVDLQKANNLQRQFYNYFKAQFLKERYLDIENNSNYAFVLMFDLADDYKKHKDYELLQQQLETLAENYPVVAQYINRALSEVVTTVNREEAESTLQSYDKSRGQLCKWVTPNETIEVQGIKLTRGNFYIGECFRLPDSIIRKNSFYTSGYKGVYIYGSVLNPDLPASNDVPSKKVFCSYKDMSPAWRYEYLMWLSGKMQAVDVSVEILLFYLYGCEIRMFIDPRTKKSERRTMLSDIIGLYKSLNFESSEDYDGSLQQKLSDFIGCAIVKYFRDNKEDFYTKGILKDCSTYQDYYIAQKIAGTKTLSPEDAFGIANEIYDIERLVPSGYISVAREYFMEDFTGLYKNLDANFEMTTQNKSFCYYSYFNNTYFNSEKIDFCYTIDSLPSNLWMIQDAIRSCYWSVESRFRRYNQVKERSGGKETIAAIQLLPDNIDIREIPKIQTLIAHIESEMQSNTYLVKQIDWLLALWEYERKDEKSIHKEYADSIIGGLRRLGFDIVPDYEIDKKRFNFGDICVIYKNEEHYPVKSTTKYDRSELFIKLASHIVLADKASNSDIAFVEQQLKSFNNTAGNHFHLMASIRWRFQAKKQPIDKRTQSIADTLTREQRTYMGNALIRLTCIDGDIHPKRIDRLKKVLPLLGIESDNIHAQVHRLLTDSDGFAVVEKRSDAVEFAINGEQASAQRPDAPSVIINPKKLRIFEQQTKVAQELLSDIFVDEETAKPQTTSDNTPNVWMDLLKLLLTKDLWERSAVENMCKERGLMLGAVLEQINDFAYEKVDDAVVEDDGENIYVMLDYKEQLI
ncbi:MAG: TerB N-terminal domain-containing protein [Rikenellaceae bacterium]|nr:TerB N-terminal domain-containing protein [Rikenellaceae bacterium]